MSIEKAIPASELPNTHWQKPDLVLPAPSLKFLLHLECDMDDFHNIGSGPFGDRKVVVFKGGRFEGPDVHGEILPGGGDWSIFQSHDGDQQTVHLDVRFNLKTHDGALLYWQTTGIRTGKQEVLQSLGKEERPASDYRMRVHVSIETGDERYTELNRAVIIASAGRVKNMVVLDAYEVL